MAMDVHIDQMTENQTKDDDMPMTTSKTSKISKKKRPLKTSIRNRYILISFE